jgi:hypothetical protein
MVHSTHHPHRAIAASASHTELRVEVPCAEVAILDGYCQATGRHRTDVIRALLADWSAARLHEATVIVRMAARNPAEPESGRQ